MKLSHRLRLIAAAIAFLMVALPVIEAFAQCLAYPPPNPFTPAPNNPTGGVFSPGGVFGGGPGVPPGTVPPAGDPLTCNAGDGYDTFLQNLKVREGVVKCVYRDSLGYPTVGVGHLVKPGDNLQVGDCISDAQVDAFLQQDAQAAWAAAQQQAGEINNTSGADLGCLTVALASVNYQLGTGWRQKFPSTWSLIQQGKYCEAADAITNSLWARQTPVRVADFQAALRQQAADSGEPCT